MLGLIVRKNLKKIDFLYYNNLVLFAHIHYKISYIRLYKMSLLLLKNIFVIQHKYNAILLVKNTYVKLQKQLTF